MMKKALLLFTTLFCLLSTQAQVTDSLPCPPIILDGPPQNKIIEGDTAIINVRPFDKAYENYSFTYNWSLDNGNIFMGQGTSRIYVEKMAKGKALIATVEVGGLKLECPRVKSISIEVIEKKDKKENLKEQEARTKGRKSNF